MSDLTDEMRAALLELADELGEGLTATLIESTQTYDHITGGYVGDADPNEWLFVCPPPSGPSQGTISGSEEAAATSLILTMPRVMREDGTPVVPQRGQQVRLRDVVHQILRVRPITIGDADAGFSLELAA